MESEKKATTLAVEMAMKELSNIHVIRSDKIKHAKKKDNGRKESKEVKR